MQNQIVEITSDNVHVSAERGFLKVTAEGEIIGRVVLDDIAGLVVRGYGASFSAMVCDRLAERNAPIVICGQNQSPVSVIWPVTGHHLQGFHMQAQAVAKKPLQKRLWAALVATKIRNQGFVLAHVGNKGAAALSSKLGGFAHVNTAECYFSIFKRGVYGTFHSISAAHTPRYLAEFDMRFNTREMSDGDRAAIILKGAEGKRLMYRQPCEAAHA